MNYSSQSFPIRKTIHNDFFFIILICDNNLCYKLVYILNKLNYKIIHIAIFLSYTVRSLFDTKTIIKKKKKNLIRRHTFGIIEV